MKKNRLLSLVVLAVVSIVVLQSNSGGYSNAVVANSSAPGCSGSGCHNPTAASTTGLKIEVFDTVTNTPITTYDANTSYLVKISLEKNNVQTPLTAGFQASFFGATNNNVGTYPGMSGNPQVQEVNATVGGVKIITHRKSNVTAIIAGSTVTWEFYWKTPFLGGNDVIISALSNDADASSTSSGDLIKHTSLFLPQNNNVAVNDYSKGIDALYPNPTTGNITLNLEKETASNITVYSVTGQVMKQIAGNSNQINIDLSNLASGNYIISVRQGNNIAKQQFVKF